MCVKVRAGAMGCGKSRHRSREDSDPDTKNSTDNSKKDGWSSGGKRKKSAGSAGYSKSSSIRDGEKGGGGGGGGGASNKSSPSKRLTNGARSRLERSQEVGVPLNLSANRDSGADGGGDPNHGANVTSGRSYTLEVPNEITKQDSKTRVTCKDFKSMTSSKTVHITNSQIEFFKMLDEKIEKGDDCFTSGDVSEVSSIDETSRH